MVFQVESSCTDENDEILTESSSKLERNLRLLGVTAIEDSLQVSSRTGRLEEEGKRSQN